MRFLFILVAITATLCCPAQNITGGEYFIDTDPGYGNATAFSFDSSIEIDFSETVTIEQLQFGYHTLYYRLKDSEGKWSQTSSTSFFKAASTKPAEQITQGEYFFDTDPGYGNGIAFSLEAGAKIDFTQSASINTMHDGYHTVYYRLKDNEGNWGQTSFKPIYKTVTPKLAQCCYQIDDQEVTTIHIDPVTDELEQSLAEDITSLEVGEHQIKFWVVNDWQIESEVWTETFTLQSTDIQTLDAEELTVYPNPATDFINIKTCSEVLAISVYSLTGQLVLQNTSHQKTVDLQNIPKGMYLILVKTEAGIVIKQIVKK